ncbi:MAG: THUMP domain-containing protein, partial [Nitrososphaera sp.]|nr:THUMP domain-containing protein [Nitrososphaera sp.]
EPWQVRYVLRVIPVHTVVSAEPASISNAARKLAASISNDDTYRITVEKRHSKLSSTEIIASIANDIHSKVDLESPSWVVLVQILGAQAGISVLRPEAVFSSVIEKRK